MILIILATLISPLNAQYFTCDNGNSVYSNYVCDGDNDCGDGSDETSALCTGNECYSWEFQCEYGGCVGSYDVSKVIGSTDD